jgi:hypothetical protein
MGNLRAYERPTFYQNYLPMRNTAAVTGGKPITVWSQSISGVRAVNPLVALYNIHGINGEMLFFYFVPDTTRDVYKVCIITIITMFCTCYACRRIAQPPSLLKSLEATLITSALTVVTDCNLEALGFSV